MSHGRLTDKQVAQAASALSQLANGWVWSSCRPPKSRCKKKIYLPAGQHRVKVGSERDVKVRERRTVTVGSCT